jgi:hypothetical protein
VWTCRTLPGESGGDKVALLKGIDEGKFEGGVPLDGSLVFFTGSAKESVGAFSSIEGLSNFVVYFVEFWIFFVF